MISVQDVSKSFGKIQALNNLSFEVAEGEIVGLLGPNGAGKTTTMRILTGFLSPDSGSVKINNLDVLKQPVEIQKQIGYLPENNPLYKEMLVSEVLNFSAALKQMSPKEKRKAFDFVVSAVNIDDIFYRPVGELSKGYKQRVGLALVLLHQPKILIMDEPTEGLDPNQRVEIRALIKRLAKSHTIILSTHVMQEVEAVCQRMVIINKGKLVADGTSQQLLKLAGNQHRVDVELEGDQIKAALKGLKGVINLELSRISDRRFRVKIVTDPQTTILPELSRLAGKHNWTIWRLEEEKQHLEQLFQELTRDN